MMGNELMRDETRERFENQTFPENVTPCYAGRMNKNSSLGRYFLGISAENLPVTINEMSVRPITYGQAGVGGPHLSEINCYHELTAQFDFEEDIAAYYTNYSFFDVFGEPSCDYGYLTIQDAAAKPQTLIDRIGYDYGDGLEIENGFIVRGLIPANFHVCLFGISILRTTDGGLKRVPPNFYPDALDWAFPFR